MFSQLVNLGNYLLVPEIEMFKKSVFYHDLGYGVDGGGGPHVAYKK